MLRSISTPFGVDFIIIYKINMGVFHSLVQAGARVEAVAAKGNTGGGERNDNMLISSFDKIEKKRMEGSPSYSGNATQ